MNRLFVNRKWSILCAMMLLTIFLCACSTLNDLDKGAESVKNDVQTISRPENTQELHIGKTYIYEQEGFGGSFSITLNEDGTYTYYEGMLSSYFGFGTWSKDGDIITLKEDDDLGYPFVNHFRFDGTNLYYIAEDSSNFLYIKLNDGEKFFYDASKECFPQNNSAGAEKDIPYSIQITRSDLQIFDGPSYDAVYAGALGVAGTYTIIEEGTDAEGNLWGKLQSGAGWVNLTKAQSENTLPISVVIANEQMLSNISHYEYIRDDSEYMVSLLFSANEVLKNVQFSILQYGNGVLEVAEELYSMPELTPDIPLAAGIVFCGDMTTYGISFIDAEGVQRDFYVYISGRNGALMLQEINPQ